MSTVRAIQSILNTIQSTLFVSTCKSCDNYLVFPGEKLICVECKKKIDAVRYADKQRTPCQICGRYLDHQYHLCGNCIIHPPPFHKHASYTRYDGIFKNLILRFKYCQIEGLKVLLAQYLIQVLQEQMTEKADFILPVPADKGRKREYHPMLEVAKIVSRRLDIPLLSNQLIKVKKTLPQAGLSRAKRLKNLDGAFAIKQPEKIKKKKIILIDDVYTTGTTIRRCSEILRDEKAIINAFTLARS